MEASAQTRTQRRRAQTRFALIEAARTLIAEKGVGGLRVGDVTERADVAFGSFYNHFETKDDVVEAVVAETVGGLASAVVPMRSRFEDPAEQMSVAVRYIVGLAYRDRQLASLLVNINHAEARFEAMILDQARAVVEGGVANGRFVVADVETTARFHIGACLAVIRAILDDEVPDDADVTCAEMVLHSCGIDRDEAREIGARELPALDT